MVEIKIISIGTLKDSFLKDAVDEYTKKLSKFARIQELNLKEVTVHNEDDRSEISRALSKEGEAILAAIPKESVTVAMCIEGKEYDSEGLAALIGSCADKKGRICFIIGSSHGLSDEVKRASDIKLSLSRLTFPHQLMRVILLEAIYRSFAINSGTRYHK